MAFAITNLRPSGNQAGSGKAFQSWNYITTDSLATCDTAAYFNDASTLLKVGDEINIQVVDDVDTVTAITDKGTLIVDTNASGVVDTNDSIGANKIYLTVDMTDISTAASVWVVAPVACTFTGLWSVINAAITSADAAITTEIGGTAVTGGAITIANSGSAAGDVDSATPTAANTLTAGQALEIITDGGSSTTSRATFTVELTPSGQDSD